MNPNDEFRTLRNRLGSLTDAIDRADRDRSQGVPRYCGRVYSGGALPTAVPRVYLTRPLAISATESEGATPTLTADATRSVPVLVIGPGVPVAGNDLIARQHAGRWVAPFPATAAPVVTTPCSPCAIPRIDLSLSWTYLNTSATLSTQAITLTYAPNTSGGDWGTVDAPLPTDHPLYAATPGNIWSVHSFHLFCQPGVVTVRLVHQYGQFSSTNRFEVHLMSTSTFACSPFSADWSAAQIASDVSGLTPNTTNDRRLIVTQ